MIDTFILVRLVRLVISFLLVDKLKSAEKYRKVHKKSVILLMAAVTVTFTGIKAFGLSS
jgi:hypothetical protein